MSETRPIGSALDRLNRASESQAAEWLRSCNGSLRWGTAMVAGRPYADATTTLDAAERESRALAWPDVLEALAAHPRIGERPNGNGTEAEWSREEQAAVANADAGMQQALVDGNRAYEQRFGHVFLIRAAGRAGPEVLAALRSRLANDDAAERAVVTDELAQITRLRMERLLAG
jgi:2-oxo-4-hydroxy-4-carboxy-5-ureidoimidazoline decarboxylase